MSSILLDKDPRSKDLPVLRPDALDQAWQRNLPWYQLVTGPSCRLFLAPDRKTYILDPLTQIWKELVNNTIAFTGPKAGMEWEEGRVFKYVVVADDVGKCARDMSFLMDTTRGPDYITREDYSPASSDRGESPTSDSQSTSQQEPPAASPATQDRPSAPKVDASDSHAGPSDAAPQDQVDSSSQGDPKRLKHTRVTVPPVVLPQSAPAPAPALGPIQTSRQLDQPN